ncbi:MULTISPECIES: MaoC family dehydratase [Aeribacillus]|jgi:Acyl dehydratase|uniref:Enoyl-CoA hydratase n=1 Tax=Aeribacillus pallidus TaxID=33936 RepID=A0A161ZRM6_9BACI|nr:MULTISPECIES: MaoC family dehydratase [Aeribacillus]ASS88905.1 enoyl-CoA hydratase [Aeribacillus pallidus]KZM55503.1 enoyl-CoA hydratase [Aeribacillus pallidus]KZN95567.1 enoyl-CoA hydratase [Aeribacillus pallidus]MED0651985.1 MaoC family dehydratase [Aeribacillus composti]MED4486760.1 MaoC family dehydratase [Aeribacillus pallidus]
MTRFTEGQTASCSKTITEADVVLYAGLSGDFNPIHIDKEYAKNTRFKERIAHGLLTSSLLSQLLGMYLPGKGAIYMEQTLRFTAPVYIGDTITATATVQEFIEEKNIIKLLTECRNQKGELVLMGSAVMLVPKEGEKV